ncbi:MAG: tetratricopeptide repeat protein [Sandaracinus sp.]|nr:tetratricopeptide repeat protein [Sandaracinus sp.]
MSSLSLRSALVLALGGAVACGGGGGGGGGGGSGNAATTEGGDTIRSASGEAVSVQAHNHWTAAVELIQQGQSQGWNSERCDAALSKLDDAIDAQGGTFAEALYMSGMVSEACNRDNARGFYERALSSAEAARQRNQNRSVGNGPLCKSRVALGLMDLAGGNQAAAMAAFQRAVREDAQCTSGYTNLAILQREQGGPQEEEALRNLRRALAIESDYLPAFNQMALLYYSRGRRRGGKASLDLAEVVCRQAQLIDRNFAPIYNTWGLVKIEKGDVIEALRYFQRAIELDGSIFEAQMNFGSVTLSFRGYQDAQRAFARAVELQPRNYDAHIGLGAALRGLNQFAEAKAEYERAREIDGNRPEAIFNLALLHQDYLGGSSMDETIGNLNRAKELYQQFLAKAGNAEQWAETVESVSRRCRYERDRRGRESVRPAGCRPGRVQNIERTVEALREAAAMQAEADRMQREAAQQQQQAPAPAQ